MNYTKYENRYIYPMIRFSSSVPNFDNDWSAWKENQEILAYEDAIFIALGMNDFSDYDINVHVFSNSIPLTNFNNSYPDLGEKIKNKVCLYEGTLFLEDKILDIGEEFDDFSIPTKNQNIYIKIYGDSQSENRLELICLIEETN